MVTPDRASECVRIVGSVAEWATVRAVLGEPAELIRTRRWGPLTERRVLLPSGLEIEFGFVPPGWASVDPVDLARLASSPTAAHQCTIRSGRSPASSLQ